MTVMFFCAGFAQQPVSQSPDASTPDISIPRTAPAPPLPPAPAVNPGRPTVTDTAPLTAPGYLELEAGLNHAKGGAGLDYQVTQALLLKLTDRPGRTEFRVSTDGHVIQRTTGGSAAVSTPGPVTGPPTITSNSALFAQGFGDINFGLTRAALKYFVTVGHTFFLAKLF